MVFFMVIGLLAVMFFLGVALGPVAGPIVTMVGFLLFLKGPDICLLLAALFESRADRERREARQRREDDPFREPRSPGASSDSMTGRMGLDRNGRLRPR